MTLSESASLSPEQLRVAVAERLEIKPQFYLMKRGLYYRPNGHGYTSCESEAWKLSEDEANKHVYPHDEPVTKHPAPYPNYPESRDACATFEATLTDEQREKYCALLMPQWDDEERAIWRDVFDALSATATQRCRAFLAVSGNE